MGLKLTCHELLSVVCPTNYSNANMAKGIEKIQVYLFVSGWDSVRPGACDWKSGTLCLFLISLATVHTKLLINISDNSISDSRLQNEVHPAPLLRKL